MSTVLITGANGFLGHHLVKSFLGDADVRVVAGISASGRSERLSSVLNEIVVVPLNQMSAKEIIDQYSPDIVIHAAVAYGREITSEVEYVNVTFPLSLAKEIARNTTSSEKKPRFIHIDTFYSKFPEYKNLVSYTSSKRRCVEMLKEFSSEISVVNVLLEHLYGAGDSIDKFIPGIVERLRSNEERIELTSGEQERDFIEVSDAVSAIKLLAHTESLNNPGFKEFSLGTGRATTIRYVVELLKQYTASVSELAFGALPYRDGEPMRTVANMGELQKIGFKPKVSVEEGLKPE